MTDAIGVAEHHLIRVEVFVHEQGLFANDDRDEYDELATTLKVVGYRDFEPAGTVRLFPLDAEGDHWQGDRLAVLTAYRRFSLGMPLVRFAVATAGSLGGTFMTAHIQPGNITFFQHLGWHCTGAIETYVGVPHQPMGIALTRSGP